MGFFIFVNINNCAILFEMENKNSGVYIHDPKQAYPDKDFAHMVIGVKAHDYVYDDKFGNDTLTFTNEFDGKNRLTAYTVKSHTTNVSRHFDYPD
jgi:hypothetical protein